MLGGPPADWSERQRREAWRQHRDELMATHGGPGHRLAAWWDYDAGDDAPLDRPEGMSWSEWGLEQLRYVCGQDLTLAEAQEIVSRCSAEEPNPRELAERAVVLDAFPEPGRLHDRR